MALWRTFVLLLVTLFCLHCYGKIHVPHVEAEIKMGTAEAPNAREIEIPIDHFLDGSDTYNNRYWFNATYYKTGGPVFLIDTGEQGVTPDMVAEFLMEATYFSAPMQLAKRYNGLAILWEHRFYGESLPFPLNDTGYAEAGYNAYKYLTTEQALEDVVFLSKHFQPPGLEDHWTDLRPDRTPWIFLGGSYSGVRAALMRIRNPEAIYASWSSSAPVQAKVDMSVFCDQVSQDMTANCSANVSAASRYLDASLSSGNDEAALEVKALIAFAFAPLYRPVVSELTDAYISFLQQVGSTYTSFGAGQMLLSFIGQDFLTYGFDSIVLLICDLLEQFDPTSTDTRSTSSLLKSVYNERDRAPTTEKGIAAQYGDQAAFFGLVSAMGRKQLEDQEASLESNINTSKLESSMRVSWLWQTCTEYGFYQVAPHSSQHSLVSHFVNADDWQTVVCEQTFGYSQMPSEPDTSLPNHYGVEAALLIAWSTIGTHGTLSAFNRPQARSARRTD